MYKDIISNMQHGLLSFLEPDSKFMPISFIETKPNMWLALWQKNPKHTDSPLTHDARSATLTWGSQPKRNFEKMCKQFQNHISHYQVSECCASIKKSQAITWYITVQSKSNCLNIHEVWNWKIDVKIFFMWLVSWIFVVHSIISKSFVIWWWRQKFPAPKNQTTYPT